jgi:hypothetical protein
MGIKSRGETLTFREGSYWDDLDEEVEPDSVHDLGNTYDGGYPEDENLTEAQVAPIPNFTYLAGEASARDMIIEELLNQKVFGVRRNPDGSIAIHVYVEVASWGTTIQDFNVTPEGRIMLDCLANGSTIVKQQDLQTILKNITKRGDGSKFLNALKNIATKLNKSLDPRSRRERHDEKANRQVTNEVAEYLRDHITNLHFSIPLKKYDAADVKAMDANASDEDCEAAAKNLEAIRDRYENLPFVDQLETHKMVSDRIPNEKAAWIAFRWGAECKFTFDRPLKELVINEGEDNEIKIIDIIKAYQWKSTTEPNPNKKFVDCFTLAVKLITHFDNDVRFFEKKSVTDDVDNALDLDFPEV